MNPFEFVLGLITLILIFKLIKLAIDQSQSKSAAARHDDAVNAEWTERLRQIEERVQVLERIVTDERYDLKRQFKDLGG